MTDYLTDDKPYDIECYPNVFTLAAKNLNGGGEQVFEISERRNDIIRLLNWLHMLRHCNHRMIGFNNLGYDYPVIHCLPELHNQCSQVINAELYQRSAGIIYGDDDDWTYYVPRRDHIVTQIDLYKIWHFDNNARRCGLKDLEFAMQSENIQDLPFPPGSYLYGSQIDDLIEYNLHGDVENTRKFALKTKKALAFRESLGVEWLNFNDTKIGKQTLIRALEADQPGICYDNKKPRQTIRNVIHLRDVIFPYVNFYHPAFNLMRDWFASQSITETKGIFSNVPEYKLGHELADHVRLRTRKIKIADQAHFDMVQNNAFSHIIETKTGMFEGWRECKTLNVVVNGFQFDFGTGGIHGSVKKRVVRQCDEFELIDVDVASYYPNLSIKNRLYPEHLSELFCTIYEGMYNQRLEVGKKTTQGALLKLALNGSYGDSNNQYSPLFDPQFTMAITVNGQLLLCMLADRLMRLDDLELIQINTDGMTARVRRSQRAQFDAICKQWEADTLLELEAVNYEAMYVRDVNNYIGVYADGSPPKFKGAYVFEGIEWHKNHSSPVVAEAAAAYMLDGAPVRDYLANEWQANPLKFMRRCKVPRSAAVEWSGVRQQRINRYLVTTTGGELMKIYQPRKGEDKLRHVAECKGWSTTILNDLRGVDLQRLPVDLNFYESEVNKLIVTG